MSNRDEQLSNGDGLASGDRLSLLLGLIADDKPAAGAKPDLWEIQAWHLGKLDKQRAAQVKSHVARDPMCYQLWSDLLIEDAAQQYSQNSLVAQLKTAWAKLVNMLFDTGWQRPIVISLTTVFVMTIGIQIFMKPDINTDFTPHVVRGSNGPVYITPDPASAVKMLVTQLTTAGATVLSVQINEQQWSLRIEVKTDNIGTVQTALKKFGIEVDNKPPYRLIVRTKN